MKNLTRVIFCIVTVLSIHFVLPASPVYACSGFPEFGVKNLPDAELLVKATVIDADDSGFSAVLRVEDYYKGTGSRLITVMRFAPALQTGALVRGYDTGCLYSGLGTRLFKGDEGYFGLASNGDGTFIDYINGEADFYAVNGEITYRQGWTEGFGVKYDVPLEITEKAFIQKMLEAGNRKVPVTPTDSPLYPLMRFVNITTKNGTHYQINPDRSIKKVDPGNLLAISPDGAHVAFRLDDQTIAFQYIWTTYQTEPGEAPSNAKQLMVKGQAVSFSSDNNLVAIWDLLHLSIYMINNRGGTSGGRDYFNMMNLQEIATREFSKGKVLPKLMWSANGSTLVWQESNAIWYWNIFDNADPSQLLSGDKLPDLMAISRYGRYMSVGNWTDWRLIDTQTNKTYHNTIVSPNELYLIAINHKDQFATSASANQPICKPPLRANCQKELSIGPMELRDIYPFQMELLGIASCNTDNDGCIVQSSSWHPAIEDTDYSSGRNFNVVIEDFRSISFDVQYQRPVILVGDYSIYFDLYDYDMVGDPKYRPYLDILDLKGKIDSPIVSVEWGQPVFYDTYKLSSIEYQP